MDRGGRQQWTPLKVPVVFAARQGTFQRFRTATMVPGEVVAGRGLPRRTGLTCLAAGAMVRLPAGELVLDRLPNVWPKFEGSISQPESRTGRSQLWHLIAQ